MKPRQKCRRVRPRRATMPTPASPLTAARRASRVQPEEALALVQPHLAPWKGRVRAEIDELGDLLVFVRVDMLHLDADALHDRLHHWTLREIHPRLPAASAHVSFRHARPDDPHAEFHLDLQEGWRDLEPTLRLETRPPPARAQVEAFVGLFPRFLALVDTPGRPEGFRDPHAGNVE